MTLKPVFLPLIVIWFGEYQKELQGIRRPSHRQEQMWWCIRKDKYILQVGHTGYFRLSKEEYIDWLFSNGYPALAECLIPDEDRGREVFSPESVFFEHYSPKRPCECLLVTFEHNWYFRREHRIFPVTRAVAQEWSARVGEPLFELPRETRAPKSSNPLTALQEQLRQQMAPPTKASPPPSRVKVFSRYEDLPDV